eukprot:365479-Chlamydomonas_euryale.AAC.18
MRLGCANGPYYKLEITWLSLRQLAMTRKPWSSKRERFQQQACSRPTAYRPATRPWPRPRSWP